MSKNKLGLKPWELLLTHFKENQDEFGRIQRAGDELYGLVICLWAEEDVLEPSRFHNYHGFTRFDDETVTQEPKIYRTIRGIEKRIERIKEEGLTTGNVGLWFWTHPEHYDQPNDDYLRLRSQIPFPGSP